MVNTRTLQADVDRKYQKTCLTSGCHTTSSSLGAILHPPFMEGRCLACHTDHAAGPKPGLVSPGDDKCLACHTGMALTTGSQTLVHPPGGKSCTDCHNPHQGRVRNLLREEGEILSCSRCHADFLNKMAEMPFRHHYLDPKAQCGACHYAHRRPEQKFLRENVAESCLTCHDLPLRLGDRALENVVEQINQSKYVHGAMTKGACPSCHTPHGSPQPSLLKSGYPAGSYENYKTEQYALCWECHDKALAEDSRASGVTRFRNGEENLHWRHITSRRQGRACHLCHAAHASDTPHLIRSVVKWGSWPAPLIYKPLPDGGSCQSPCHREKEYHHREFPNTRQAAGEEKTKK